MTDVATQPAPAGTATWQIDPAHTQVEFEVKHMMFARVRGRFEAVSGDIDLGPEGDHTEARVQAVIQAASIDTGQPDRDAHLRSEDFLDVDRFPELRFESRGVDTREDGVLGVRGSLTIRGVTREVELDVTETGRGVDPWGNQRIGFTAATKIDRRDFGLTWNQALEAGGVLVGHEVRIRIEVQAVLQSD